MATTGDGTGSINEAILVARSLHWDYPNLFHARKALHPNMSDACANDDGSQGIRIGAASETAGSNNTLYACVVDRTTKVRHLSAFPIRIISVPERAVPKIHREGGDVPADSILRSMLLHYWDYAEIRYLETLNRCWRRFAVCKELAAIVMGEGQGRSASNLREQLNMALDIGRTVNDTEELSREMFSWFMAMELMLPWRQRKALEEGARTGIDRLDLARAFWVPKAIVDLYFDTNFHNFSRKVNAAEDDRTRPRPV